MQTVLAKIVADKAIWVEARKAQQPLASFQNDVVPSSRRRFYDALQGARTAFILECKKASPSKGVIVRISIRRVLPAFISIMRRRSVLTDEKYFRGQLPDFLPVVSSIAPQPIHAKTLLSTRIRSGWRVLPG